MRVWIGTLCILALLQHASAAPQEETIKASIEGIVTRADDGKPIAGAQVTISRTDAGIPPPPQTVAIPTDADGSFQFKDLVPGTYRVIATATDFVRQEYGQRSIVSGLTGTPIELTAGQSMKNAAIRLTATGTVRGRILNDRGQPAVDVPVQVLQYVYEQIGLKTLRQIAAGKTNDRGEYRVFGITPGRYYLAMGSGPGMARNAGLAGYVFKYFPGVNDVRQASLMEIKSGGELVADMTAVQQKLYNVRGRVVDSVGQIVRNEALDPGQYLSVSHIYTGFDRSISYGGTRYDNATGNFEILNLTPGAYTIRAEYSYLAGQLPAANVAGADRQSVLAARAMVDLPIVVHDTDVENLVLAVAASVTVSGKLSVEGQQFSEVPGYDRFQLRFLRFVNGSLDRIGDPPQQQTRVSADGKFQVVGMRAGEYSVYLLGVPPTLYLESVAFDGNDILGKRWKFDGNSGAEFSIVLGSKPGQVSGTVIDAKGQPVSAIQAVLIPDANRDRADLYKNGVTDLKGHFAFAGVAPGNYKLFAWDGLEPYRYSDPDFMKTQEARGKSIVVGESAAVTADIQAIPIAPE